MTSDRSMTLERDPVEVRRDAAAGVKTILLHIQNDAALDQRLETAFSLARACDAHLNCLHVTPIEAYVAFDSFGGVFVMNDIISALDQEEERLKTVVQEELRSEDLQWDYVHVTGNVPTSLLRHAALSDLIVVGREPHRSDFVEPRIALLGDLLHRSTTPLFVPATNGGPVDPTGTVVIAWDGSHEAANAVRAAVGLLKLASDVRILQVRESAKTEAFPGTKVLQYLSRHDIHAELQVEPAIGAGGKGIAGVLLAYATANQAAYMVMGGYSHSRMGEFLFGGVTRTLLGDCPLPLLVAH